MKKVMTIFVVLVSIITGCVTVQASVKPSEDLNAVTYPCPNCAGTVTRHTSNRLDYSEYVTCIHGKSGKDCIKHYTHLEVDTCNQCTFTEVYNSYSYNTRTCQGY